MILSKNRVVEVDIAKGIGILLVVIGHSIPDANTGIKSIFAEVIFSWIYSFHMALFMAMAGFLFWNKLNEIKTVRTKINEIKKRAIRLLVPYCVYSFAIFGAKLVLSSWSRKPVGWTTLVDILFGNSPCGNVWFLWTLFVICALVLWMPKNNHPQWMVLIFGIGYFFQDALPWFEKYGIERILNMALWFCVGLVMAKQYERISAIFKQKNWKLIISVIMVFGAQVLILNAQNWFQVEWIVLLMKMILCALGISLIWIMSIILAGLHENNCVRRLLQYFGRESMSIYLLSYFVQTPGVTIYAKIGDLGIPYYVWVFSLAIGAIVFSLLVSKLIIRKSKLLRRLLIGE